MALHFHWPHDFWKRCGWIELRLWLREMRRQIDRHNNHGASNPHTWAGAHNDGWFAGQRSKHKEMRGG